MPPSTLKSLESVELIQLPCDIAENGNLVVMQGMINVPFAIARVFVVKAGTGAVRGQHAHKACTQFLTCPYGRIKVVCHDGNEKVAFVLDRPDIGLLVPHSIWATQTYLTADAVLTVLCDRPYDSQDYIRDFDDYRSYRAGAHV